MQRNSRMITTQWGYQNGGRLNPKLDLRWQLRLILESVMKDKDEYENNCDGRNYVACQAHSQIRESCEYIADNFGDLDILEMLHEEVEHLI